MFDHTIRVSSIDIEICMRIRPLPLGYRTFEIQCPRMVVNRERMVSERYAHHSEHNETEKHVPYLPIKNHLRSSPMVCSDTITAMTLRVTRRPRAGARPFEDVGHV